MRTLPLLLTLGLIACSGDEGKDTAPAASVDADSDGISAEDDCDDDNADLGSIADDADCDGALTADDCDDANEALGAIADDADCDGTLTADDCDDNDAASTTLATDADCDGTLTADDCDDNDAASTTLATDADCDGTLTADDCDDNDATFGDIALDADCDGTLTADDCDDTNAASTTLATDADCDGTLTADDCDDNNATSTTRATDADCDGVLTADDCDDYYSGSTTLATDADCDGTLTADDCDDNNATSTTRATDADCDGVLTANDCDDTDAASTTVSIDADCDGVLTADDCDDTNAASTTVATDADCDGFVTADDCDDTDAASLTVATDADCDGVLTADDCDDNDDTVGDRMLDPDCDGVVDAWTARVNELATTADYSFIAQYSGDAAGYSVSSAGDVDGDGLDDLLVGASSADGVGLPDAGKTYLILGASLGASPTINLSTADYAFVGEATGDKSGFSVSSAGDVDGDGLDDLLVGAWVNDEGGSDAGKTYLILGASLGASPTINLSAADYAFVGEAANHFSGFSISSAGDVDGDGLDDLLVSAYYNNGSGNRGKTYLILGASLGASPTIDLSEADYSLTGEAANDYAGYSVSSAGDVDGDGLDDLLVGAMNNSEGGTYAGKTYLILGSSLGATPTIDPVAADYSFVGEAAGDSSGYSVSSAGDVDGDGLADLLVGAYGNDAGGSSAGKTYLILGASLGASGSINLSAADYAFIGEAAGDFSGISVSSAGDVDGDGLDDLLVGAYQNDEGGSEAGKTYLILGSSLGASGTINLSAADYAFVGEAAGDLSGRSVSSAGDVNGDGLDDLLVGAHLNDQGGSDAGKAYLLLSTFTPDDGDGDGVVAAHDCDDSDGAFGHVDHDADCDGVEYYLDCDDDDPLNVLTEDCDQDGVASADDCDDDDPANTSSFATDADCDGVLSADDCDDDDPANTSSYATDADCDGILSADDCDDTDPLVVYLVGDCDGDGVDAADDCDDNDATSETTATDGDCDGVLTADDCDDTDPLVVQTVGDCDADGVATADDCDDNDASLGDIANDADCDGTPTADDCDDNDGTVGDIVLDRDCDGVAEAWTARSNPLTTTADYLFTGEEAYDQSGWSVSSAGDVDGDGLDDLLVGAYANDEGGSDAGKTYLILGASLGASGTIDLSAADYAFVGEEVDDYSGSSVSSAGDVDGDGLDDLLVAAVYNDEGGTQAGKTYLIMGSSLGASSTIDLSAADYAFVGEAVYDFSGGSVSSAGDVDGDGLDDLLVGAWGNDEGGYDAAGKTYLILGASLGASSTIDLSAADYTFVGEAASDKSGNSVSSAGDVDGDGLDDLLVAAYGNSAYKGKTYLILGASLGASSTINLSAADYTFVGEAAYDYSGTSVSSAGDVDGDGLDDLLVGASGRHKTYLILGASLGASSTINLSTADYIFAASGGGYVGHSVSSAGDVDGDGLADLLLGAYGNSEGAGGAGKTYLILGASLGTSGTIDLSAADYGFIGEATSDNSGRSVSSAGDVNGDGLDDLLVGAFGNDEGGYDAGKTYLILSTFTPNDGDNDGVVAAYDCDDTDPGLGDQNRDADCDGVADYLDCDDSDPFDLRADDCDEDGINRDDDCDDYDDTNTWLISTDADCDGVPTSVDCDDSDPVDLRADDCDEDGINRDDDCDDNDDTNTWLISTDADCDGVHSYDDCDDADPLNVLPIYVDADCDGVLDGWADRKNSLPTVADYVFIGEASGDLAGTAVASAGDVDGDGINDILIGAYKNDEGGLDAGKTYLFFGSSIGASSTIDLSTADYAFVGEEAGDTSGYSVSSAGDVDDDGLDDLLIGAHENSEGGANAGKAYIILAASLGVTTTIDLADADYHLVGESTYDKAGNSVSSAGDVDGDGLDDLLVGAWGNDAGGSDAGTTYLILGSSLGATSTIDLSAADYKLRGATNDKAGWAVSGAGDVDGDTLDDVLVAAWTNADNGSYAGKVCLFLGGSLSVTTTIDLADADYCFLGATGDGLSSVASAGDVDGDGLGDFLMGSQYNDEGGSGAGKTYLMLGGNLGATTTIDLANADYGLIGDNSPDAAGYAIASAGDVDGDGLDDLFIGAPYSTYAFSLAGYAGRAHLVTASRLGPYSSIDLSTANYDFSGLDASDNAGIAVSSAGDINGDGLDDLLVGANGDDDGGPAAGKVYLILSAFTPPNP